MLRPRIRKRRLTVLPFSRLIPNIVTLGGLCCGLSSIRFAMESRFEVAVALLVASAIIDGMDGRIARLLNSTSVFGAQLDSLSDFLCFGVAPVLVLYMWKLESLKGLGWPLVLFFSVCCALRLARFNTDLSDETLEPWQSKFFVGIPSPAGAMMAVLPIVISFYATSIFESPVFCSIWIILVAILMVSRLPTFAAKKIRIHHNWVLPVMLGCCILLVLLFHAPWQVFTVCVLFYCGTIPLSVRQYQRLAALRKQVPATDDESLLQ